MKNKRSWLQSWLTIRSEDVLIRQKGAALVTAFRVFGVLLLPLFAFVLWSPAYQGKRLMFLGLLCLLEVMFACCIALCRRVRFDAAITLMMVVLGLGMIMNSVAVLDLRPSLWGLVTLNLLGSFSLRLRQFWFNLMWSGFVLAAIWSGLHEAMDRELLGRELMNAAIVIVVSTAMAYQLSRAHVEFIAELIAKKAAAEKATEEAHQQRLLAEERWRLAEVASKKKGDFLANISHELRTPLNAILGYAELLHEEFSEREARSPGEVSPQLLKDTIRVHVAGRHLLELIQEILNLSDIESGELEMHTETFALAQLCEEVVASMELAAQMQDTSLNFVCEQDFGAIESDPVWVRQILFNLLSNAIKFTHDGEVEVRLCAPSRGDRAHACIVVSDTGVGMSEEEQERVFEEFVQANEETVREFGGTGIGLSLCYKLVSKMGGTLEMKSALGEGTRMTFMLPLMAGLALDEGGGQP